MIRQVMVATMTGLAMAGCAQDDAPDFCDDRAQYGAEYAGNSAKLSVVMSEDGRVETDLRFPIEVFDATTTQSILQDVNNIYSLQTDSACAATIVTVSSNDESILANYVTECGADNKLGQFDVSLFDSISALDEVEVKVVAPATQKHFLIHRQCAAAIFRF